MQVRLSDHNSDILRNRTTNKIVGRIFVSGTDSDGSDQGQQIADILHKTNIKTVLRRGGEETILTQDKLGLLCLFSGMGKAIFPTVLDYVHKYSGEAFPLSNDYIYREGTGYIFPIAIDLGCYINLDGNDELILDVNCNATQLSTITNANINLEFEEAVGVSHYVVCTRMEAVPPGQSSWQRDLGHNVIKIALLNLDIKSTDASDSVISDIQVNSDKLTLSDTFYDLLIRRLENASDAETAKMRQNFVIYYGTELDKVKLNFGLNSAAVTQGMNYVAHQFYVSSETLITKAQGMITKHQGKDLLKFARSKHVVEHAQNLKKQGEAQKSAAQSEIDKG